VYVAASAVFECLVEGEQEDGSAAFERGTVLARNALGFWVDFHVKVDVALGDDTWCWEGPRAEGGEGAWRHLEAELFVELAGSGFGFGLAVVDEACGQFPQAAVVGGGEGTKGTRGTDRGAEVDVTLPVHFDMSDHDDGVEDAAGDEVIGERLTFAAVGVARDEHDATEV
jgi:hypothetical protein